MRNIKKKFFENRGLHLGVGTVGWVYTIVIKGITTGVVVVMSEPLCRIGAPCTSSSHFMDSSTTPVYRSRNVLHRRGSVSASDPFGIHAEQNLSEERFLISRLTIVRVSPEESQDSRDGHRLDSTVGPPLSRRSSCSSTSPSLHPRSGQAAQSRRLSFASSSFAHEPLPPVTPNSPPSYANRKRRPSASLYAQRTALRSESVV